MRAASLAYRLPHHYRELDTLDGRDMQEQSTVLVPYIHPIELDANDQQVHTKRLSKGGSEPWHRQTLKAAFRDRFVALYLRKITNHA
jgi:hypothetical protein